MDPPLVVSGPFSCCMSLLCPDKGCKVWQEAAPAEVQLAGNPLLADTVQRGFLCQQGASLATAAPRGMAMGCQGKGKHGPIMEGGRGGS